MERSVAMGYICQRQRVTESDSNPQLFLKEGGEESVSRLQSGREITSRIMLTVHFAGSVNSSRVPKRVQGLREVGAESLI